MANRRKGSSSRSHFRIDDLHVQPERNVVIRGAEEIKLERRMMEVLEYLAQHAGETVGTGTLLVELWGSEVYGDNPVNKTVSLLRKLIGDNARNPRYIQTINKVGYRMIATVSMPEDYRRLPTKRWANGSPYVGLTAFDARHAPVYCGRGRIVADLLRAMRSQIDSQRRFVMLIGASGCGKTSLLHAGAIPLLTKPDGYEGLRTLSIAACDLAAAPAHDPLTPLIEAIARWTLDDGGTDGGRPVFPPQTTEQLKSLLAEQPSRIQDFVTEAFRRHPDRSLGEQPCAHLLLTIDHAETLVASADIDTKVREAFEHLVLALCDCPHVLVVMIARSDFYPKLIETLPALAERKAGDGHLDVLPPRYGEIAEIIRTPAWKANLGFEVDPDSRDRLDDVLRDAAVAQPDALPLLQHTLQTLYERRSNNGTLTFSAYNDIGGLEGAIAHRAEQVFATLSTHVQASLNTVLARLIVIQPDSDAVSARRTFTNALPAEAHILVNAFTAARLFVGDHSDGMAIVGVAHEALLRRWPRAVDWVNENRRLLHARARLQRAAIRWMEDGQQEDHLLNPGRPLGEALEVEKNWPETIDEQYIDFIRSSERARKIKANARKLAMLLMAILTTISITLAVASTNARREADKRRRDTLDLLGYILVDISNKLRPTGDIEALDDISKKTLAYLQPPSSGRQNENELINKSRALRIQGEIRMQKGDSNGALLSFSRSLEASAVALKSSMGSADAWNELGQASYWTGLHFYQEKEMGKAEREWRRYLLSSKHAFRSDPDNHDRQIEISYALNNIGSIKRKLRKCDLAIPLFKQSAEIKQRILNSQPENHELAKDFVITMSWLSSCEESSGNLFDAKKSYKEQAEILRSITSKNNNANTFRQQLAMAILRYSMLSVAVGDIESAKNSIPESVRILSELTRLEPENSAWRRDLAFASMEAANISRLSDNNHEEKIFLESASQITSDLLKSKDPIPEWIRLDAALRLRKAASGYLTENTNEIDIAIATLSEQTMTLPEDKGAPVALAKGLLLRHQFLSRRGNESAAKRDLLGCINALEKQASESRDHQILKHWAIANLLLGRRDEIAQTLDFLKRSGFNDPDFVAASSSIRSTQN